MFYTLRLIERFPNWVPDLDAYSELDIDTRAILDRYNLIRIAEDMKRGIF